MIAIWPQILLTRISNSYDYPEILVLAVISMFHVSSKWFLLEAVILVPDKLSKKLLPF